ncbi:MAG TPA: hypothetical protein VI818_02340 [Candidatus Thermoplasmatota archaeon]|nr:hypothetical protein [Candidatus Thermoplasmatota archaeon]
MLREDADATADVVSSVFRGEDEVNDEDLDKEVRALFYTLEQQNLLGIRRTEYKFEGQTRRAYFWRMKEMRDEDLERTLAGISRDDLEAIKVYRALPQELWNRGKN